ncbi:hypothetical protein T02_5494 [Trichinella nativa]|uniref:Uncharacterized protein n=1 Tax=Trichinella nativa TaxID=6335 RepID=A0A0V1KWL3_9BILA|nr:hypothetical protein T06_2007 [Trichinella sp. T6]KRZ51314.1 hypothetical protein T02_5494 [Trichinella nativa]
MFTCMLMQNELKSEFMLNSTIAHGRHYTPQLKPQNLTSSLQKYSYLLTSCNATQTMLSQLVTQLLIQYTKCAFRNVAGSLMQHLYC